MSKDELRDACVPIAARLHLIKAFRGVEEVACGDAPERDPPPATSKEEKEEEASTTNRIPCPPECDTTRAKDLTTMSIDEMKQV